MEEAVIHPEGHRLRPFFPEPDEIEDMGLDPDGAHMFCRNCGLVNPSPEDECDDFEG